MLHWAQHLQAIREALVAYRLGDLLLAQSTLEFTLGNDPAINTLLVNYPIGEPSWGPHYDIPPWGG
eukprot:3665510-Rhodomonas_salina.2